MRRSTAILVGLLALAAGPRAQADGAFPDSMQIMVPPDKPHEIVVGANFGLLVSEDDGTTWNWLCEDVIGACAHLYQMNAPPSDTILTLTAMGLVVLSNNACTQALTQASFGGLRVAITDAFPDPTDPAHVLATGFTSTVSGVSALYESRDRGLHFASELYEAPAGLVLSGVENARATTQTVYLTANGDGTSTNKPTILRSTDGGNMFQAFDQSAMLGARVVKLAAVDPTDAQKLYLRASDTAAHVDSLAISEDGGATSTVRLSFPTNYQMTAFLKMADGTLLVAGLQPTAGKSGACGANDLTGGDPPAAYISTDGGQHFDTWSNAPRVRALGERAGVLYAVTNNYVDGFAVATSTDKGAHWTPILRYDHIGGPLSCQAQACAAAWANLMDTFGINDGGTMPKQPGGGCGCSLATVERSAAWPGVMLGLVLLALRAARRRRCAR
jgi:hypothetical protein